MGQVGQVGREGLLGELDNWYHEDSGGVSDLLDLDLFNELQAEEPPGEIHILMQPMIEVGVRVILHFFVMELSFSCYI